MKVGHMSIKGAMAQAKQWVGHLPRYLSVGLDIGSTSIKVVVLSYSRKGGHCVEYVGHEPLFSADELSSALVALQQKLIGPGLYEDASIPCHIALNHKQIYMESMVLREPVQSKKLMHHIHPVVAEKGRQWGSEVIYDYDTYDAQNAGQTLLMVMVKAGGIQAVCQQLQSAFWYPKVIEVESFAFLRGVLAGPLPVFLQKSKHLLWVEIGFSKMILLATKCKLMLGHEVYDFDSPCKRTIEAKVDFITQIIEKASQQFFLGKTCHAIVLAGGQCLDAHFYQALKAAVNCPLVLANPFKDLAYHQRLCPEKLNHESSLYTLSFGLAIRGVV